MYATIKDRATGEYEEKKSVFIGNVKPIKTEDEAKEFINEIKSKHKEARHNVYAYIIGKNQSIQRYSDDGEPQGTGGIPVLQVIKNNNITDVVVVVTRYFGGVLLGAAGLCRAYTKGASEAIKNGGIIEKIVAVKISIKIDYELLGKVQYAFMQNDWFAENTEYADKVILTAIFESEKLEEVKSEIIELCSGRIEMEKIEEDYYFKEGNTFYRA